MANTIEILLKAKNDTDKAFKEILKSLKETEESGKKTRSAFAGLAGAAFQFNNIVQSLSTVANWAKTAAGAFVDLAQRGGQVAQVSASFDALSKSVGETGDALLGAIREGTKGLVSDFDIMLASNKAMLLGLPVTAKEMGTLSNAALVLGKTMGLTTTQALNDLVTGLGRGSAAILDNLGITIKAEDAYKRYAASLGKQVNELTAAEQKIAIYKAAIDGAAASVAAIGDVQLTFADRMVQMQIGVENFRDSIGKAIAQSPVLNTAMGEIANAIQKAFGENQAETIKTLIDIVNDLAIGIVSIAKVGVQSAAFISNAFNGLKVVFAAVVEGVLFALEKTLSGAQSLVELAGKIPGKLGKEFRESAAEIGGMADKIALSKKQLEDYRNGLTDTIAKTEQTKDATVAWLDKLQDKMEAAKGKIVKAADAIGGGGKDSVAGALKAATEAGGPLTEQISVAIDKLQILTRASGEFGRDFINGVTAANTITIDLGESTQEVSDKTINWSDALTDLAHQFEILGGTAGQILSQIAGGIASIQTNLDLIKNSGGGLGGVLGKITGGLGIAGTAIGAVKGIFGALFGGAKKAREEMEKLKSSFISSQGGMTALAAKAREAGIALDAMFRAKSAPALQAAIAAIQGQLQDWDEAQQHLREAMEEYGITVEQMGPKFAQQELDKQVAKVAEQFQLLTIAGADAGLVAEKMGDKVMELVRQYQTAGLEIPEALRPVLEAMLKNGQLTDENGDAYESLEAAGIKFAKSMTDAMTDLMTQVQRLVEALARGFNVPVNFHYTTSGEPPPENQHGGQGHPGNAWGGFYTQPTLSWMAEGGAATGGEYAIPEDRLAKLMQQSASMGAAQAVAMMSNSGGGGSVYLDKQLVGKVLSRMSSDGSLSIHPYAIDRGQGGIF